MSNNVMERRSSGLYWDRAWKLVEGCTKISPGCANCWSETETLMRSGHPNAKIQNRANMVLDTGRFSGRAFIREDNLDLPLRTKKPTVFSIWNDLYHEDVPEEFLDAAYSTMALCPQHTFIVLTKRAERMAKYCRANSRIEGGSNGWNLPNVWHGVTAENQQTADERIPHLLQVPGKRFLSIEPMLGPVDLSAFFGGPYASICKDGYEHDYNFGIHAVLLGGESGKNARPMHPDWARGVRDHCFSARVPFFFKQWGEFTADGNGEFYRVGKKKAGRTLDGRLYNDLPWG